MTEFTIDALGHSGLEEVYDAQEGPIFPVEADVEASFGIGVSAFDTDVLRGLGCVLFRVRWELSLKYNEASGAFLCTRFSTGFRFDFQQWLDLEEVQCREVLQNAVALSLATARGALLVAIGRNPQAVLPSFFIQDFVEDYLDEAGPWKDTVMGGEQKARSKKKKTSKKRKTSKKKRKS